MAGEIVRHANIAGLLNVDYDPLTIDWASHAEDGFRPAYKRIGDLELIKQLELQPHPEGGHFRETFRTEVGPEGRSRMTAILFLLREGERSHWHRVDADELWLWQSGGPLTLLLEGDKTVTLGADVARGEQLQALVPAGQWQAAEVARDWALVSCVVAPGFELSGFELAPPGWNPPQE